MKITHSKALAHIAMLCAQSSQKDVAKQMGISPQHLCDLLHNRRNLAGVDNYALAAVGLRKQVTVEWDLEERE